MKGHKIGYFEPYQPLRLSQIFPHTEFECYFMCVVEMIRNMMAEWIAYQTAVPVTRHASCEFDSQQRLRSAGLWRGNSPTSASFYIKGQLL